MEAEGAREPEGSGQEHWGRTIRRLHGERDADGLINLLEGAFWVSAHAREALADLGLSASDALLNALDRHEPAVRASAAGLLGALGERRAVKPLLEAFRRIDPLTVRGPEFGVWEAATDVLGRFRVTDIVDALIDVLRASAPVGAQQDAAQAAAKALSSIGDSRAVPALVEALAVRNPFVVRDVADALRAIGDELGVAAADERQRELWEEHQAALAAQRGHEATLSPGQLEAERRERREHLRRRVNEMFGRRSPER